MPEYTTYSAERLHEFSTRIFQHFGVPKEEALLASDVLGRSDLRGIDSHGVARLHTYFGMLNAGKINPTPKLEILRQTASTATVDGDNGLGLVVGPKANEIAMNKAAEVGTGWVSVSNTNHYGIAGYYVLEALKRDLIGWAMTNTTKIVAPLWGAERMLGTNPIAIAFPGLEEPPIVIDMASCVAAFGKVEIAQRHGQQMPDGWAIDADGQPTNDPAEMIGGGAILPLGSDREGGGHKGYCLALMVDVLCAVLSGANWGPWTPPFALSQAQPTRSVGKGIGHFFGAMQIDGFIEPTEFKRQIDDLIRTLRGTRPAPGTEGPLLPGDPEREAEAERSVNGIPLVDAVVADLREMSTATGIPLD
ncbi:MAG: L-2-hydroxycarboxylate dehydrogenase (NAD+) [Planctomycetota bacterium]|jgi:L-2-hydroxycarboxylate dehydrogenase (NAD+)